MKTHIALLRGINMAGHKVIKMEDLRKCFESMRFKNIRTYIQSGNVIFESTETDTILLAKKINKGINKSFGYDIAVILRTADEMAEIVRSDPYKKVKTSPNFKPYVTFVAAEIMSKIKVPSFSPKKDIEIISISEREFFCLSHEVNGKSGFPNSFIEKEFKVAATTRNWNTTTKLASFPD